MSSRSERQAATIWLLTDALVSTHAGEYFDKARSQIKRLYKHITLKVYDKPMIRVQNKLIDFTRKALGRGPEGRVPPEKQFAYSHMLVALISDQWSQCPAEPKERKRDWKRLNNAVAETIEGLGDAADEGAELGASWADEIYSILKEA